MAGPVVETKPWKPPEELIQKCWNYAVQAVTDYKEGRWPESRFYSTHGAENDEVLWTESKLAECAFCVWADLDPLSSVRWEPGPDLGRDVFYREKWIDVKHTRFGRFLMFPFNKVTDGKYERKPFDLLVLVTGTAIEGFVVRGWTTKQRFYEQHEIAGEGHVLHPGDWCMDMDNLDRMATLKKPINKLVNFDHDQHQRMVVGLIACSDTERHLKEWEERKARLRRT